MAHFITLFLTSLGLTFGNPEIQVSEFNNSTIRSVGVTNKFTIRHNNKDLASRRFFERENSRIKIMPNGAGGWTNPD